MIQKRKEVHKMSKVKSFIVILFLILLSLLVPTISNAAVEVTRNIYSNNGSMKFEFTGLTLDTTHEYEYGLTQTTATTVGTWHLITEYTATTATVDVVTTTKDLREVINAVDTGYITIKDKTEDKVILKPTAVDLKTPFLSLTNYTVIPNGKQFDTNTSGSIQIALRCKSNSNAYYQYEKITDTSIINKYKELKANSGDYLELQSMLKQTAPTSNWQDWKYWNGYSINGMNGFGYPQKNVSVPDTGLYYMWLYFAGENIKNVYGYILVDNLEPDIALESISLPQTQTIVLGKTLTLTPTFNPTNATNKIVTWSSSDESVVTVSNAGLLTAKKVGSAIITVVSQDGNKKATCNVTVTEANQTKPNETPAATDSNNKNNGTTDSSKTNTPTNIVINTNSKANTTDTKATTNTNTNTVTNDTTVSSGKLPQTGVGTVLPLIIFPVLGISVFTFMKYRKFRNI